MLTVGRLVEHKGQDQTLRALALLRESEPDLRYAIAGSGAYGSKLRALAAELGVEDRVNFLGHVEDDDLPALYNVAEIYVGASRVAVDHVEGFGISLVEASATSLPVIAGREGGMPEAVEEDVTALLADPYDPASLARRDRARAAVAGARCRSWAAEGRRVAESRYSWQRVARDLARHRGLARAERRAHEIARALAWFTSTPSADGAVESGRRSGWRSGWRGRDIDR